MRPVLAVLLLAVVGCGSATVPTMVSIPPPRGWEAELAGRRAERDRQFREDAETPLLAQDLPAFSGLRYWSSDASRYLVGNVEPYPAPQRFMITTTSGAVRPCEKVGWIRFRLDGRDLTLQVYRLLDAEPSSDAQALFLPFLDGTSGNESYPGGRYVDLLGPPGGPLVLDFNGAYNPSCAYGASERFACPVTPPENRLDVRIEAGERAFKTHDAAP